MYGTPLSLLSLERQSSITKTSMSYMNQYENTYVQMK